MSILNTSELTNRIDALLNADDFGKSSWQAEGLKTTLTYKFEADSTEDFRWTDVGGGFVSFTSAEITAFKKALNLLSDFLNIEFVELSVTSSTNADLSFFKANDLYLNNPDSTGGGRGRWQYSGDTWNGQAVFNAARDLSQDREFDFVMHEIGHALGLKHPGDYDVGGNNPPGPFLPTAEDNEKYTVMSYTPEAGGAPEPSNYMVYDYASLQKWWGANTAVRTGTDVYTAAADSARSVIWDGGGVDAIANSTSNNVVIDLRQGAFSSVNGTENLVVAYGTIIENAQGGAGNDTLIGNSSDNLMTGGSGNDIIDGGAGTADIARYFGNSTEYTISKSLDGKITVTDQVDGRDGIDQLTNIESLLFSDKIVTASSITDPSDTVKLSTLATLIEASSSNLAQFNALSVGYNFLGGVPSVSGFISLINTNIQTNFGSKTATSPGPIFNDENVYINIANALYQGNATLRSVFDSFLASESTLAGKLSLLYDDIIAPSARSEAGKAFFQSQSEFYIARAAELGISGINGAAVVGGAALTKIAVDGNLAGTGDSVNDLAKAVMAGSAALPISSEFLTPREIADGTAFDGNDTLNARLSFEQAAINDEVQLIQTVGTIDDPFVMV